jgi:hypothetical protein
MTRISSGALLEQLVLRLRALVNDLSLDFGLEEEDFLLYGKVWMLNGKISWLTSLWIPLTSFQVARRRTLMCRC